MTSATPVSSNTDGISAWKSQLDELATHLMIEGPGAGLIAGLQALRERAEEMKSPFAVSLVDAALERLATNPAEAAQFLMQSGIAELQGSLESEGDVAPPPAVSLGEDPELVSDFLVEAREHLSLIEGQMLTLERDPSCMEVIHAVFRAFHTIKGLAGFLDFSTVQAVAHEVETILDLARNEKLAITSAAVDVILESGDFLNTELGLIEHALKHGELLRPTDPRKLAAKIVKLAKADAPAESAPVTPSASEEVALPVESAPPAAAPVEELPTPAVAPVETKPVPAAAVPAAPVASAAAPAPAAPVPPVAEPAKPVSDGTTFADAEGKGFIRLYTPAERAAMRAGLAASAPSAPASAAPAPAASSPAPTAATSASAPARAGELAASPAAAAKPAPAKEAVRSADSSSVRVETAKLDHLMDMVGEIVIAQSLIRHNQAFAASMDSRLLSDLAQLARVTGEVQRATMSMRMVPIGNVFQRVERVIRDLSRKAGKQVVLETFGSDTEIDKTVAEELSDPLLHMVRNSVDHGIETPAERLAAGKPAESKIRLSARHQSGLVIIEISDDGRGLNSEKIRKKAEERNLVAPNTQLTETEVYQLIFEPGFSTAEKITDVSGRGVGMDVVRRNVEKLRGRIETQSTFGQGTTFALKLPLTLAIIDGLVVEVGSERYIIPISAIREMFKPEDDAHFTVEGRAEMLLVRGQLLPVIRLDQRLGIMGKSIRPSDGVIVVVESHGKPFCLLVDDLLGKQEVVIKNLGETFKDVSALSGCAVLGDGCVGLILDIDGIFRGGR